jgi:hypothetical protein
MRRDYANLYHPYHMQSFSPTRHSRSAILSQVGKHRPDDFALPGQPGEQAWRYPRAGRQDDQQGGAVPDGEAVGAGPGVPDTPEGADTTWYGAWE